MTLIDELQNAFHHLKCTFEAYHNSDLLELAYAEFTLKCYAGYADQIYSTILHPDAPLTDAFRSIGIDTPRDQLPMLLATFYHHLHTGPNALS